MADLISIHDLAGSNVTQRMAMPGRLLPSASKSRYGFEISALCRAGERGCTEPIEAIALDDLFGRIAGAGPIYQVVIDTEGWDGLVLEGMRASLIARRVAIFSFEYTYKGFWASKDRSSCRSLSALLTWVGDAGYECFWQTKRHLVPASGACLSPASHGEVGWSNLLCAHEPRALQILYTFVPSDPMELYDAYPTGPGPAHMKVFSREHIVNTSRKLPRICTLTERRNNKLDASSYYHCNCA